MRAEITFLSGMIFRIDEDGVVGAGSHAGFAADADRFIEIDDAVSAFEHRGGWARGHAGRVRALITPRHLMCATHLRKYADVDMLNVRARHANRDDVLRLAGSRARMTTNAARMVDDLRPLHAFIAHCLLWKHFSL